MSNLSRLFPLVVALAISLPAWSPADDKLPIAVVNVDKLFSGYKQHEERLAPIRTGAKELDESVQIRQVELETVASNIRKTQPNTPEFLRLQAQALKMQNELQAFLNTERGKLQKKEVSAIIATQKDVDEAIKKVSKERGLKLVLRQYNPPDENQPLQEVIKNLNRDVVFQDGLDITDDVLKVLNEEKSQGM